MKPVGIVAGIVVVVLGSLAGFYIAQEGPRRDAAVLEAVGNANAAAEAEKEAAISAAVATAVAETEARLLAGQPTLTEIDPKLRTDDATLALFPDGAFLLEVGDAYKTATCSDVRPNVVWVDLHEPPSLRATVRRQTVNPLNVVAGWLTLGLTAFGGPDEPIQTVFAGATEGNYTTLVLGALREWSDAELVAPQVRLTLFRIDPHTFGVVEWVPMDIAPAARPEEGPATFTTIYRRCAYSGGEIADLG